MWCVSLWSTDGSLDLLIQTRIIWWLSGIEIISFNTFDWMIDSGWDGFQIGLKIEGSGAICCSPHVGGHPTNFESLSRHLLAFNQACKRYSLQASKFEKIQIIVPIAFLGSQTGLSRWEYLWLPGGNQSISQETIPRKIMYLAPGYSHARAP